MPAGTKEAEARVKEEPEDAAAGVKRERPEEDAAGLAGAKHVKAEPKIEPDRSGAATPLPAACGAGLRCGGCFAAAAARVASVAPARPPACGVAWRRVRAPALSLCRLTHRLFCARVCAGRTTRTTWTWMIMTRRG